MDVQPYRRRANYYETDQMGIIHHSNYIRWFEEARVDYLEQLGFGYRKSTEAGIEFALTGLSCEYRSMVRFGDTVWIRMRITRLTPSRLHIGYEVTDSESGELRATGETRHCFYDQNRQRPVALKKALPELFALLEAQLDKEEC